MIYTVQMSSHNTLNYKLLNPILAFCVNSVTGTNYPLLYSEIHLYHPLACHSFVHIIFLLWSCWPSFFNSFEHLDSVSDQFYCALFPSVHLLLFPSNRYKLEPQNHKTLLSSSCCYGKFLLPITINLS